MPTWSRRNSRSPIAWKKARFLPKSSSVSAICIPATPAAEPSPTPAPTACSAWTLTLAGSPQAGTSRAAQTPSFCSARFQPLLADENFRHTITIILAPARGLHADRNHARHLDFRAGDDRDLLELERHHARLAHRDESRR